MLDQEVNKVLGSDSICQDEVTGAEKSQCLEKASETVLILPYVVGAWIRNESEQAIRTLEVLGSHYEFAGDLLIRGHCKINTNNNECGGELTTRGDKTVNPQPVIRENPGLKDGDALFVPLYMMFVYTQFGDSVPQFITDETLCVSEISFSIGRKRYKLDYRKLRDPGALQRGIIGLG